MISPALLPPASRSTLAGFDCHGDLRTTRRTRQACPPPATPQHRALAKQLLDREIDFIANTSFYSDTAREHILESGVLEELASASTSAPRDLPAHLARMCETPLLTAKQEQDLFRRMNYLKFRANALRATLDADNPRMSDVERIGRLLRESEAIRDQIVKANMRLVMSVVKKFVTPQYSFDELLSDGVVTLMSAVDKFDYDRGFRFSTYAYRSIARNAYRSIMDRQKESGRFSNSSEGTIEAEHEGDASTMTERAWESLRSMLSQMMGKLDRREQFIIRGRYALGPHRKVRTFQSLADKLGVSKERVRQLEQRAVGKLRSMSADMRMDEVVDSALA